MKTNIIYLINHINMKKYSIYLFMIMLVTSITTLFTSCNDDDEPTDEWSSTYAYIESNYFLRPTSAFILDHTKDGEVVGGEDVVIPFTVRLNQIAEKDVTLGIKVLSDNIPAEAIKILNSQLSIKKGEYESAADSISIPDWTFAKDNSEKTSYSFTIAVSTDNGDNYVTLSSNRSKANFEIIKNARCNMEIKVPEDAYLWKAKAGWSFAFQDGVENSGSNSVAGTGGSDVATNGVPFWVTVDLQDIFTITGIQTTHWASGYAPRQIEVYQSEDGENWKSLGVINTAGGKQNVAFITPIKTRYLKYQMLKVPSRVDLTGLYVYLDQKPSKMTFQGTTSFAGADISRTDWSIECKTPPYSDPYTIDGVIDGDNGTAYFASAGGSPIEIDMKSSHLIKGVSITGSAILYDSKYATKEMQIFVSSNGQTWTNLYSVTLDQAPDGITPQYILFNEPIEARYMRIAALEAYNGFFGISEFNVYE